MSHTELTEARSFPPKADKSIASSAFSVCSSERSERVRGKLPKTALS